MTDFDLHEEYRLLRDAYDESERLLTLPNAQLFTVNEAVSKWSPAQQLYHLWLAGGRMLKAAQVIHQGRGPVATEGEMTRIGRIILGRGVFPRGKAQAPENVRPPDAVSREELSQSLDRSRRSFAAVEPLLAELPDAKGYIEHPFFGALTAAQWVRCARIHTEHHLAIIRDILA